MLRRFRRNNRLLQDTATQRIRYERTLKTIRVGLRTKKEAKTKLQHLNYIGLPLNVYIYQLWAFILNPEAGRWARADDSKQLATNLVSSVVDEDAGNVDTDHQDEVGDNLSPRQHHPITKYHSKRRPPNYER